MSVYGPSLRRPKRYADREKGTVVSAELASYGGDVSAGQGPYGFEPPLSPPTAGASQNSMMTNMHGYLGLVPGPGEQAQTPAVGFSSPEAVPAAPVSAPNPAA